MTITAIDEVVTVVSPKNRRFHTDGREWFGLSFCESGMITYYHNDRQILSDPAHAVLLPQGQRYHLFCSEGGNFPVINFLCTPGFCVNEFIRVPLRSPESYLKDYERLKHLFVLPGSHARCMGLLYEILGRLATEEQVETVLLEPAIAALEQHYDDPRLNNAVLASLCNISEVYFRRLFRQAFGSTPRQYLLDLRIRRAKQLLSERSATVTHISERCGFSSVYHFCRAFREITGQTPTQYAAQWQIWRL